ncbi:MAG TPA: hypothetical protein VEC06_02275 [Paucimonas sp.]|nr:hypothetical protein [Paucimonas sp.]
MKSRYLTISFAALAAAVGLAHAQTQCWAPRDEQDASTKPPAATLRKAVLAAESIIRKNQAYMDSHVPVRMRTMIAIGPYDFTSARMFVNAYPEYGTVGHHVWRGECDVIPQADRIAAAVGQIGVFFNPSAAAMMPPGASFMPKFEGTVAGYPRYNGWVYMTKDGRMPWIPETLGQRLDREIAARERKLADWMKDPVRTRPPQDQASVRKTYAMLQKSDPEGAERYLASMKELEEETRHRLDAVYPAWTRGFEKAVADAKRYKASFSVEELAAPAVWGDSDGQGRKQLDARLHQLRSLPPDRQQEHDDLNREARTLERQAQQAARAGDQQGAARLRAQSAALSSKAKAIKKAHAERISTDISEALSEYDLVNIRPGDAEHAMGFVADPDYFDKKNPYRIRLITVLFSLGKRPGGAEWMQRARDGFDFQALAALLN